MKNILLVLIALFAITQTVCSQTMKVYQNGQLKAVYYVSKDDKVEFSDDFPFPDDDKNKPNTNGHEYVDLGLPSGLKWATMNVGATTPEDCGQYFAWGETTGYGRDTSDGRSFNWASYKMCSNGDWTGITKYTFADGQTSGIWYNNGNFVGDNKTTLDPEDDAAHVNWGGDWRMPTKAEQDELRNTDNCFWRWTTKNGVKGYEVTSKKNGNSIFLPVSGDRLDSSLYVAGSYGFYWSSSRAARSYRACYLEFDSSSVVGMYASDRCDGYTVRAVCQ